MKDRPKDNLPTKLNWCCRASHEH